METFFNGLTKGISDMVKRMGDGYILSNQWGVGTTYNYNSLKN